MAVVVRISHSSEAAMADLAAPTRFHLSEDIPRKPAISRRPGRFLLLPLLFACIEMALIGAGLVWWVYHDPDSLNAAARRVIGWLFAVADY
jgi:hypothetical protein